MEQETTTTAGAHESRQTDQLVRPQTGRVLAGVSVGLANRFDTPTWVPRLVFVLLAFFGGLGVALYAAGWALIRSEDEDESAAERFFSGASSSRAWIGVALIFVAALILLDNFTFVSGGVVFAAALLIVGVLLYMGHIPLDSPRKVKQQEGVQPVTTTDTQASAITTTETTDVSPVGGDASPPSGETPVPTPPALPPRAAKVKEYSILGRVTVGVMLLAVGILAIFDNIEGVPVYAEPRHYMALAVTILGLGLLVGAVWGRARWLILVAVVLVPTMLFSPVFEYDWSSEAFDVSHQPMTFLEIESIYTLDLGNMVIDLTELPWDGDVVDITARVDVGNLEIRIPNDVGIIGSASVDVGRVGSPGRESAGLGDPRLNFNSSGTEGTVMLDAQVDLGNIDIRRG